MASSEQGVISTTGSAIEKSTIAKFQESLDGRLIRPSDEAYEAARRVRNRAIDRRPGIIVRCAGQEDVVRAVGFAREHDLLVAVRGGGHSYAGHSVCEGGLVIDLSPLKGIQIDRARRVTHAQAGLTLGEYDTATKVHGLATPLGTVADTGVAGLTLGGGLGWLMGKYGLSCDNVVAVDLVTADGRTVRADAQNNEDLHWGVRGGSGNFGVVTAFDYHGYPVSHVIGGRVTYPLERAGEFMRRFRDFSEGAPDELTSYAMFMGDVSGSMFGFFVCYCGEMEAGEKLLRPLRSFGQPVSDSIRPMTYLEMQGLLGAYFPADPPMSFYVKSGFLSELSGGAIDAIVDRAANAPGTPWMCFVEHFHGAASRVEQGASAFPHRTAGFGVETAASWQETRDADAGTKWVRSVADALQPFSDGGVYVNRLGEEGEDRVRAAYGPNYERLVALKNKYDPDNFFRLNQNIKPTMRR